MKIKNYYNLFLLLILLTINNITKAQADIYPNQKIDKWNHATKLYNNKNFGNAYKIFDNIAEDKDNKYSDEAEFYKAACAYNLNLSKAYILLERYIQNHSENKHTTSAYMMLGNLNYENENYEEAIDSYKKIIRKKIEEKTKSELKFKLGYSYLMLNDLEKASFNFYEIKDINGDYHDAANYYYAHIAYTNKKYGTALKSLSKIENTEEFSPLVPYYKTHILFIQERYKDLISYAPEYLDKVAESRVDEMHKILGLAYYNSNDYKNAEIQLSKSPEKLNRNDKYAYGYSLYKLSKYKKAITVLQKIGGKQDSLLQISSYCLAACYLKTDNKQGAKMAFYTASKLDYYKNIKKDALFNYAKLTYELSYSPFNETISAFDTYIKLYPNSDRNDKAYDYLVKMYMNTNNYKQALNSLNKIKVKNNSIQRAYQKVAWFRALELINEGYIYEAIEVLYASLEFSVYNSKMAAEAYYMLAECKYKQSKTDEAIKLYTKFLNYPGAAQSEYYKRAYYNIAYIYYDKSNYTKAKEYLINYTSLEGEHNKFQSHAYILLADIYYVSTEYKKAIINYNKAIQFGKWMADYAYIQTANINGILGNKNQKLNLLDEFENRYPSSDYLSTAIFELGNINSRLENYNKAIKAYSRLIKDYPISEYSPKAGLQLSQMYYNTKQYTKSIDNYKKLIQEYPKTDYASSALFGLKNVYIDINKPKEYFKYVDKNKSLKSISASERDSLMYISAERIFLKTQDNQAKDALLDYLKTFKNGKFTLNANYYLAEFYKESDNQEKALKHYLIVADNAANEFKQKALINICSIYKKENNYTQLYSYSKQLSEYSQNKTVVHKAKINCINSAFKLKRYEDCLENLAFINIDEISDANSKRILIFQSAISNLNTNRKDIALSELIKIATDTKSKEGAEANYLIASIYFGKQEYKLAEKQINDFIAKNTSHHFWLGKSFLILADIYMIENDSFQAKYTLQSLIDNYTVKTDGVLQEAKAKLDVITINELQMEEKLNSKSDSISIKEEKNNIK
ncbi:MAG: tetratricopeptide repeat protein [Marinifilaceae bacterium]|jgi:TolA-binding protein|nr:tetratricopeptide repeat protein [Marinifilaceae bacterium]